MTPLKAQWSPNPDVYPHFTVRSLSVHLIDLISSLPYIPDREHEAFHRYLLLQGKLRF